MLQMITDSECMRVVLCQFVQMIGIEIKFKNKKINKHIEHCWRVETSVGSVGCIVEQLRTGVVNFE